VIFIQLTKKASWGAKTPHMALDYRSLFEGASVSKCALPRPFFAAAAGLHATPAKFVVVAALRFGQFAFPPSSSCLLLVAKPTAFYLPPPPPPFLPSFFLASLSLIPLCRTAENQSARGASCFLKASFGA